jgi:hypothetical protein
MIRKCNTCNNDFEISDLWAKRGLYYCYGELITLIKVLNMKTKLLKKLRANYVIMKRNTEYQLLTIDGHFDDTGWTTLTSCVNRRREHILYDAMKYKKAKSTYRW